MTFPGGAPGGYPGQAPQQPHQPYQQYPGAAPSPGGPKMSLPQILLLATAGLGVLNLFLGFAPLTDGVSFFESPVAWVPGLLLMSGLTALFGILPGEQKPGAWPAVFSLGTVLPFLFVVFQLSRDLKVGGILVLVFGILQMLAAVAAYLFDVGVIPAPTPGPAPYGGPGFGQPGQPGGFGQQPGQPGFGHPGQQPGQQPGHHGQHQGSDPSGAVPQPTAFANPVQQPGQHQPGHPGQQPGQQGQQGQQPGQAPTQYAAQQGQFLGGHTPEGAPQQNDNPGEQKNG